MFNNIYRHAFHFFQQKCSNFSNKFLTYSNQTSNRYTRGFIALNVIAGTAIAAFLYNKSKSKTINLCESATPLHYQKVKQLKQKWALDSLKGKKEISELFSRAEEIKNLYKETHFVFIHGQSSTLIPIQILIEAEAKKQGYTKRPLFKYIRMPQNLNSNEKTTSIQKAFKETQETHDQYTPAREHLISVDGYFLNTNKGESAHYFAAGNVSLLSINNFACETLTSKILSTDIQLSSEQKKNTFQLVNQFRKNPILREKGMGSLWVFCIPKTFIQDHLQEVLYASHNLGHLCNCHPGKELKILENLQNNQLKESDKCTNGSNYSLPIPQYRLATNNLTPKNDVITFRLTHLNKEEIQNMKREIKHSIGIT